MVIISIYRKPRSSISFNKRRQLSGLLVEVVIRGEPGVRSLGYKLQFVVEAENASYWKTVVGG